MQIKFKKQMKKQVIKETDFSFPGQIKKYVGKVRDVYFVMGEYVVMVVSDRISAFDVVLPRGIPYKGQVLNQIANKFLDATADIIPNWKITEPHPNVTVGIECEPYQVEMVIRDVFMGSLWKDYHDPRKGPAWIQARYGIDEQHMEEIKTMKQYQRFSTPLITPTTKALTGHDQPISREAIIAEGLVSAADYALLEDYTRKLFERGKEIAAKQGLYLVDTKYEFGKKNGMIYLIDEIHTPDSSRYFYLEGYEEKVEKGEEPKQLSKEFARQWLTERGFKGDPGQEIPGMTDEFVQQISERYIELYEIIIGEKFVPAPYDAQVIQEAVEKLFTFPVAIIMGSASDWKKVESLADKLKEMGIQFSLHALSAHRTPKELKVLIEDLNRRGVKLVIAAAGLSAALPGAIAAEFDGPVIGIPCKGAYEGLDAFLSIMDMPPGVPVLGVGVEDTPMAADATQSLFRNFEGINIVGDFQTSTEKMLMKFGLKFTRFVSPHPDYINIRFIDMDNSPDIPDTVPDVFIINCPLFGDSDQQDAQYLFDFVNYGTQGCWVGPNRGDNAALAAVKILSLYNDELKIALQVYKSEQAAEVIAKNEKLKCTEWTQYAFINE